jgi:oligopeptide transport system substrate-binding protein
MFTGLVKYNPDTAKLENAVASDISSDDNVTCHITLNEGWTFHDGTDVTAESFVRAWN